MKVSDRGRFARPFFLTRSNAPRRSRARLLCLAYRPIIFLLLFLAKSVFAGTLTGSFAIVSAGSTVDLTAQGPLDWVHWGMNSEFGFDRKASVPARIGTLVTVLDP